MTVARPSIAYVALTLNPGGTERLAVDMARAFRHEFDVSVVCIDEPGAWAAGLRAIGIPVHCVWRQPGLDLNVAARLARLFRQLKPDLVHAHQCTPWFYAALSRLAWRAPRLLLEEHGRFWPEPDKPLRRLVNRAAIAPLTHRFVAVSEDIRRRLVRYEGLRADRIEVIYNGVTPATALTANERRALRASLGLADDDFVVGTVGRLDPIKNLPMLIEALRQAQLRVPSLRGLIVGDGPEREALQAAIAGAGLRSRVVTTGHRDDARRLTQCMDLFVLASLSEGTSMALLEALAGGVAVAVTAVGGNPEVVDAGVSGWVVPSQDAGALAEAIAEAATRPDVAAQRAAAARRAFSARFSFDAMLDGYRRLYAGMLGGAPVPQPRLPSGT